MSTIGTAGKPCVRRPTTTGRFRCSASSRQRMTLEVDYNGSKGTHLQANLLNLNQVPLSLVNDLIARFGATAAVALLNSANHLGDGRRGRHQVAVPEFHRSCRADDPKRGAGAAAVSAVQRRSTRRTAAATRPGKSMYHAAVFKLTQRMTDGFLLPGQLHVLEADDQCRHVQRQQRVDGHGAAGARILDRPARPDAQRSGSIPYTSCRLAPATRWLQDGVAEPHHRRMADRSHSDLQQRIPARASRPERAAADLQRHEPPERHRATIGARRSPATNSIRSSTAT